VVNALTLIVNLLAEFGILIDPTTSGVGDSARALTYTAPADDKQNEGAGE